MIKFIKYIYIFKFKKKIRKYIWLAISKLYLESNSDNIKELIKKNRAYLANEGNLILVDEYSIINYGIPEKNFKFINKPINNHLTNIDLIIYILKNMKISKINYLEIGASVLKTFMTINHSVRGIIQTAYDLNPIVKKYKKNFQAFNKRSSKFYESKTSNNLLNYFQGDVLSSIDANEFNDINVNKFDFIFSDALHTKSAVETEFELIIKNNLKENFIIYYDDLTLGEKNNTVEDAVRIIFKKLNLEDSNIKLYTFWINGWLGEHEEMHKNAIITNIDIESILNEEKIKLPFFKKIKNDIF